MDLTQQVCSLELAKRLKELGVKQESVFYWYFDEQDKTWQVLAKYPSARLEDWKWDTPLYSAFTVAELGEILPETLDTKSGEIHFFSCSHRGGAWDCLYENCGYTYEAMGFISAATEADARAKMLIYLLENNLISLPH